MKAYLADQFTFINDPLSASMQSILKSDNKDLNVIILKMNNLYLIHCSFFSSQF